MRKLQAVQVGGPSGIKAEHLKTWLQEATREKDPDTENWEQLVSITQVAFREGYIPEEMEWTTMLLITKCGVGYGGIVLV